MKESEIIKYIDSPGLLINLGIEQLMCLIKQYPYFQTAHTLLLKSLKMKESDDFETQLSKSSAYISDRDLLFKFLNAEPEFVEVIEERSEIKEQNTEEIIQDQHLLKNKNVRRKINNSVEGMGENISETILSQLEFSVVKDNEKLEYPSEIYFIEEERNGKNNIITIDADPEDIKKALKKKDILQLENSKVNKQEKNNIEKDNTEEPFELIESEKIEKAEKETRKGEFFDINQYASDNILSKDDDLISKFIKQNPRIEPKEEAVENIDISGKSIEEDTNLLSETLIKVYIKQGLFEKALESYKKLSLKYPEKNTYFASQIKIIEDKINNN